MGLLDFGFGLAPLSGVIYVIASSVYLLYFHPASKFPGSKFSAVSYVLYCSASIHGRYPYPHSPNEVLFYTPQAAMDIYSPAVRNQELFVKTDLMDFGAGDLGFIWESDPAKRKAMAKKILPAFSAKAIKEKEPLVHHQELTKVKDGKTSDAVEMIRQSSFAGNLFQLSQEIPIIALAATSFVPLRVLRLILAVLRANAAEVKARIDKRGKAKHRDFMDHTIEPEGPPPATEKELVHVEQVTFQMFIASFDPVQITFHAVLSFTLKHPKTYAILTKEIRDAFATYDDMTPETLTHLKHLHAFIYETLRFHLTTPTGMPHISPGATVDGVYVPKVVVVQLSNFTATRHERHFADPLDFRPERWLPSDHALYDKRYAGDNLEAFFPFSLGPRQCSGQAIAWSQTRMFLGKVLWTFDLEGVRGHEFSFDRDFSVHMLWNRPEVGPRFLPRR
ncbi:cytochrome P450 [Lasiosphaeria miniovina]|uniref:Cytochrome P450 n=1 Tax=Lasiosphaeria miniovina TaxID=1954250 RepID=A0AA39ZYA2_9PEZI|nr:cytochrome P450 [Lasiosphaeria miniovina]KAK0705863.1 cytochrome P450 [Lasiosphaeria miniovina]